MAADGALYLGLDSSTQSLSAVVLEASGGRHRAVCDIERGQQAFDMGAGDEGTGGVVHQHWLTAGSGEGRKARLHGIRAGVSTGDGAPAIQTRKRFVDLGQAIAGHHDDNLLRATRQQAFHRPADQRTPAKGAPCLGLAWPRAKAGSCRDDDCREAHACVFRATLTVVQFRRGLPHRTICLEMQRWG